MALRHDVHRHRGQRAVYKEFSWNPYRIILFKKFICINGKRGLFLERASLEPTSSSDTGTGAVQERYTSSTRAVHEQRSAAVKRFVLLRSLTSNRLVLSSARHQHVFSARGASWEREAQHVLGARGGRGNRVCLGHHRRLCYGDVSTVGPDLSGFFAIPVAPRFHRQHTPQR